MSSSASRWGGKPYRAAGEVTSTVAVGFALDCVAALDELEAAGVLAEAEPESFFTSPLEHPATVIDAARNTAARFAKGTRSSVGAAVRSG